MVKAMVETTGTWKTGPTILEVRDTIATPGRGRIHPTEHRGGGETFVKGQRGVSGMNPQGKGRSRIRKEEAL